MTHCTNLLFVDVANQIMQRKITHKLQYFSQPAG